MSASVSVEYTTPLNIDGLEGRVLYIPARSKIAKDILVIYGHHPSLERWFGLAESLNQYGAVTMPDLPGFGGMDSFYKVGKKPSLDEYAHYLASFINQQFKDKSVTIVGISFGFAIVTRTLQLYPELAKRVDTLVSLLGFMHSDDFLHSKPRRLVYAAIARFLATRPMSFIIKHFIITDFVVGNFYMKLPNAKRRMIEVSEAKIKQAVEFDIYLWKINDVRTHWQTISEFLRLDNTKIKISLPVYHVSSAYDHYFNNNETSKHMEQVFSNYQSFNANSKSHSPSIISGKKELAVLLPDGLRRVLKYQ